MSLPNLNPSGELPEGIHHAAIDEIIARFGGGTAQRETITKCLQKIYRLAKGTGCLQHFIIFGSYVTAKPKPNDIDVVLIFNDNFNITTCNDEVRTLLNH